MNCSTEGNPGVYWPSKHVESQFAVSSPQKAQKPTVIEFGESIGRDQQYTILRQLNWDVDSTTWLARDKIGNGFVAVKTLRNHLTGTKSEENTMAQKAMSASPPAPSPHYAPLLDEFLMLRPSTGSHLCFVLPVYGGDVGRFAGRKTPLDIWTSKRIILHSLRGLAHMHGRRVIHTDLKSTNVLFCTNLATADIERWIAMDPAQARPPVRTPPFGLMDGNLPQPMPLISEELARRATYVLTDFGCASVPSKFHAGKTIKSPTSRAPEVFLGGEWDLPADIWAFGCLVRLTSPQDEFSMLTRFFKMTKLEHILYQMIAFTGEGSFKAEQLSAWPLASQYFDASCQLKKRSTPFHIPLEGTFAQHGTHIPVAEIIGMANFMRRCLRLNPDDRATAEELLQDPWLEGADD
ncbi:kinase-like protein [Mycena filopes]|nr:kinase-like protein [Mycena filopes]